MTQQTQQQVEKLRSLQESLDWAIDLAENKLPELAGKIDLLNSKMDSIMSMLKQQ